VTESRSNSTVLKSAALTLVGLAIALSPAVVAAVLLWDHPFVQQLVVGTPLWIHLTAAYFAIGLTRFVTRMERWYQPPLWSIPLWPVAVYQSIENGAVLEAEAEVLDAEEEEEEEEPSP